MSKTTQEIVKEFQLNDKDTGSAQVQIIRLTERINHISQHFLPHPKDHHARRGLLLLVSKRHRLLKYLARRDQAMYQKLVETLDIRK